MSSYPARWQGVLSRVLSCAVCGGYAGKGRDAWNGCIPPSPFGVNVLFLSEAPPGGINSSFFLCEKLGDDKLRDNVRRGFMESRNEDFRRVNQFLKAHYYLLPIFSFPCRRSSGGNANPPVSAIKHSADSHLREIIEFIRPKKVVLLGRSALIGGMQLGLVERREGTSRLRDYLGIHQSKGWDIETFVTYWPQKRQKGGGDWRHFTRTLVDL